MKSCDVLIVGGGPSGLSAAIAAASEGLSTIVCESRQLGGQAQMSTMIRNYPGFPKGVTGLKLISYLVEQVREFKKFGGNVEICNPVKVANITRTDKGFIAQTNEQRDDVECQVMILASGLSYSRLQATNLDAFLGFGANYGMPSFLPKSAKNFYIVGGANSAGQAAVYFSKLHGAKVTMVVRGESIQLGMSEYLIHEIKTCPNIQILAKTQVEEVMGDETVKQLKLATPEGSVVVDADQLSIFIGAQPKNYWFKNLISLDTKGYIVTDNGAYPNGEHHYPYETSVPGIFAVGDIRSESIKRIATASGEGTAAVATIHRYLKDLREKSIKK